MQEPIAKSNKALAHSLKIARKRFNKKKEGGSVSSSDEDDFYQDIEPKREEPIRKSKIVAVPKQPEDPHIELNQLLNSLTEEASNYKPNQRKFTA